MYNLVVLFGDLFSQMRSYAKSGENPPDGFMCPSGWKVLVNYYESVQTEEASQQPVLSP